MWNFGHREPEFDDVHLAVERELSSGVTQNVYVYNYSTSAYELLDSRAAPTSSTTTTLTLSGTLAHYVNAGNGAVQALIGLRADQQRIGDELLLHSQSRPDGLDDSLGNLTGPARLAGPVFACIGTGFTLSRTEYLAARGR